MSGSCHTLVFILQYDGCLDNHTADWVWYTGDAGLAEHGAETGAAADEYGSVPGDVRAEGLAVHNIGAQQDAHADERDDRGGDAVPALGDPENKAEDEHYGGDLLIAAHLAESSTLLLDELGGNSLVIFGGVEGSDSYVGQDVFLLK